MDALLLNDAACADGGILREIFKEEGFGQLTLRTIPPGVKTERHRHLETDEWWVVCRGEAVVETKDGEYGPPMRTIASGEWPKVIKVPRGTWHTIENVGKKEVILLFHSDRIYDPEHPDRQT
jgi:UDP-2-acetamido-2,6-beta-L-arabino-hexul-4-ose reductase